MERVRTSGLIFCKMLVNKFTSRSALDPESGSISNVEVKEKLMDRKLDESAGFGL